MPLFWLCYHHNKSNLGRSFAHSIQRRRRNLTIWRLLQFIGAVSLPTSPGHYLDLVNSWMHAAPARFSWKRCRSPEKFEVSLNEGTFTGGHELPWRVPKAMIGRRLTQDEAKRLLGACPQYTAAASERSGQTKYKE
jgi:hypothetical protein